MNLKFKSYTKECSEYMRRVAYEACFGWDSSKKCEIISKCPKVGDGLISGGKRAFLGEFPHMAAIGLKGSDGTIEFFCTGSLISEKFVLLVAHCYDGTK